MTRRSLACREHLELAGGRGRATYTGICNEKIEISVLFGNVLSRSLVVDIGGDVAEKRTQRLVGNGRLIDGGVELGLNRTKDVNCFCTIDGQSASDDETNTWEVVLSMLRANVMATVLYQPVAPPVTATTRSFTSKRFVAARFSSAREFDIMTSSL